LQDHIKISGGEDGKKSDLADYEVYKAFLSLLQKSFSVSSGIFLYKKVDDTPDFTDENTEIVYGEYTKKLPFTNIRANYLINEAIKKQLPVYISDDHNEPTLGSDFESDYIAAIPLFITEKL
jgi:hypothetical protein